ncbi:MAG: GAF domain-containing protein [Thermodesulfobacteriota bacterium]
MVASGASFVGARSIGRRKEDFQIREEVSRQRQLSQVSKVITSEMNRDALFEVIVDQTNRIMGTERSLVFLHDERSQEMWSLAATGIKRDEIRLPSDHGVAGWVLKNRTPLMLNDAYADPRFRDDMDRRSGFRTRNILCIPLVNLENKLIGVFQALNKRDGDFKEDDLTLLISLAIHVAIALENSRLYEEVKSLHKAKERCIDHLSHELRTPLSLMSMVLQAISRETGKAKIPGLEKVIDRGHRNLQRLLALQSMIDDILNQRGFEEKKQILHLIEGALGFVEEERSETREEARSRLLEAISKRLDSVVSTQEICPRKIDLEVFLNGLCREATGLMGERDLEIVRDFGRGLELQADPETLSKVCGGLLRNAVENTPDQGRIEVRSRSTDDSIVIEVQDHGVGVTSENMKLIFEGFFHTQDSVWYSSKRPYQFDAGGTGADLLRTRVFSERHGFSVDFTSTRCPFIPQDQDRCPGNISACTFVSGRSECLSTGGSTFSVRFPLSRFAV